MTRLRRIRARLVAFCGAIAYISGKSKNHVGDTSGPLGAAFLPGIAVAGAAFLGLLLPGSLANPYPSYVSIGDVAGGRLPPGRDWVMVPGIVQEATLDVSTTGKNGCPQCTLYLLLDPNSGIFLVVHSSDPLPTGSMVTLTGTVRGARAEWQIWAEQQVGGARVAPFVLENGGSHMPALLLMILIPICLLFAVGLVAGWRSYVGFLPERSLPPFAPAEANPRDEFLVRASGRLFDEHGVRTGFRNEDAVLSLSGRPPGLLDSSNTWRWGDPVTTVGPASTGTESSGELLVMGRNHRFKIVIPADAVVSITAGQVVLVLSQSPAIGFDWMPDALRRSHRR